MPGCLAGIPIGVVLVQVRPASPLESHGGGVLKEEEIQRLAACAEAASILHDLAALQGLHALEAEVEHDAWNLWCAGMYAGTMRIRIYAVASERHKTPRKSKRPPPPPPAAPLWERVLPHVLVGTHEWHALSRESDATPSDAKRFWREGLVRTVTHPVAMVARRTLPPPAKSSGRAAGSGYSAQVHALFVPVQLARKAIAARARARELLRPIFSAADMPCADAQWRALVCHGSCDI